MIPDPIAAALLLMYRPPPLLVTTGLQAWARNALMMSGRGSDPTAPATGTQGGAAAWAPSPYFLRLVYTSVSPVSVRAKRRAISV